MDSEFLDLCGFEANDIKKELPRVKKAFEILGLDDDDIDRAKARIYKYIDIELLGMRKILGLWIKELADMVLAAEDGKKVVYVSYPPVSQIAAVMSLTYDDVYCAPPEIVLTNTLNYIFDKINPVLETAEANGLAPGIAFCSYLQTRLGAIVKGIIPKPDLLVPSSFLCDLTPATDQLLQYLYGTPVAYVDNMVDEKGDQWPDEILPHKVKYLGTEMRNCIDSFSRMLGREFTETQIKDSMRLAVKNIYASVGFGEMRKVDPLPLSDNDMHLATAIGNVKRGLIDGPEILNLLLSEVRKRAEAGVGVTKKDAPKVMLVMQSHDPSLVALIYELGLTTGISSTPVVERIEKHTTAYTDLWDRVAVAQLAGRGANYSSLAYINGLMDSVREANVDGVIFFRHYSCRQYSIFPIKAKEMIEEELGIRVLLLEGDYCDFRSYNTQNMRTKLETFAEIVKAENAVKRRGTS